MSLPSAPRSFGPAGPVLAFIGRHGTVAFALSIFLGLALPQLAAAFRPLLMVTVFIFTMLTYARADVVNLRQTIARPGRLLLALGWATLAPPVIFLAIMALPGPAALPEALVLGMVLYVAAPVLNGAPAFAMLLGFRSGLILTILFIQMILTPALSPAVASWLMGQDLPLSATTLAVRLSLLIFGATLGALVIRRVVGQQRLADARHELNGLNVILYFLFAIAAMDGVIAATLADPLRTALFLVAAFGLSALMFLVSLIVARPFGANDGFALSIGVGLRNIGLLVAAYGPGLPAEAFLFFSLSQFATYLAPLLMTRLATLYAGHG